MADSKICISAFPMHGQQKLSTEGYRTRDGHIVQWLGRLLAGNGTVEVISRPEPLIRRKIRPASYTAPNTLPIEATLLRLPNPLNPKAWWHSSVSGYPLARTSKPAAVISWNPFAFLVPNFDEFASGVPVALDLLDDWTVHQAFSRIGDRVHEAYDRAFQRADQVYANSEGTIRLAKRYGRDDAVLLPNGTDPEVFSTLSRASGPTTVGYLGKIGNRVDLKLVLEVAKTFPQWRFVFVGPVLDRRYIAPLRATKNIHWVGDIPYREVPRMLETFDIGWVPHSVGRAEVGGDAIKIYEYHAAGLPVVSTPIIGAGRRGFDGVYVADGSQHATILQRLAGNEVRVPRVDASLPVECTWESKATSMLSDLVSLAG